MFYINGTRKGYEVNARFDTISVAFASVGENGDKREKQSNINPIKCLKWEKKSY